MGFRSNNSYLQARLNNTDMTLRIFAQVFLAMERPRSYDSTSMAYGARSLSKGRVAASSLSSLQEQKSLESSDLAMQIRYLWRWNLFGLVSRFASGARTT
jgi:hypothetical protein